MVSVSVGKSPKTELNLVYDYYFLHGIHELLQINLGERRTLLNLMNIPDKRRSPIFIVKAV